MDLVQRLKNCLDDPDRIGWYWLLRDAAKEIERLRAELAACKADAERYRWLRAERDSAIVFMHINGEPVWRDPRGDELDAAIDAARKGEGGYSPFGNSINAAVNGEGEKR